ncbi:MAG TPA: hypothetical protein VF278_19815 [Pirellulales bacterium]
MKCRSEGKLISCNLASTKPSLVGELENSIERVGPFNKKQAECPLGQPGVETASARLIAANRAERAAKAKPNKRRRE